MHAIPSKDVIEIVSSIVDVAIVGAGPYGLSLAAALRRAGVAHRIFGVPMQQWAEHMPIGMHLKSPAFGTSLYDPAGSLTLESWCEARGIPSHDIDWPIPLTTYVDYGRAFQQQLVPHLEQVEVTGLERDSAGFALTLSTGERVLAHNVVLATGIRQFPYLPRQLRGLPPELVTHTCDHVTLDRFRGRSLAVIGAGASALDFAALAASAGAYVQVFVRKQSVRIFDPPVLERPWLQRLRAPWTGLGTGWKSWACVHLPLVFRLLPESLRLKFVRRHLGPSGEWTVKQTIKERVRIFTGVSLSEARAEGAKLRLRFSSELGPHEALVDHLVAGTGYRPNFDRLSFIDAALRAQIRRQADGSPKLNSYFEASVPGLYFVGLAAAASFGPMLRFVYGVEFACKRIVRSLMAAQSVARHPAAQPSTAKLPAMNPAGRDSTVATRQ